MSFPRYFAYKDSGIEWLGEVPEHWDITKVKHIFKIGRGRVIAQDILQENGLYPVFSSQTKDNGCLGYIDTYDFDCDQITWTTDGANAGTVFIRGGKHNCTNVCGTLELKTPTNNLFYYGYYLQYATQFYKRPDTNGAKIMNNEMADILLFKTSASEQTTIAAFLDCETAKIDNLINEQKKLIELLKEKRQAVISTAVTKGLNPHAPMKDSGVEWLGEVPEHWTIAKVKYFAKMQGGYAFNSNDFKEDGVQLLRIGNVYLNCLELERQPIFVNDSFIESHKDFVVRFGDLLMSLTGTLGKTDYGYAVKVDVHQEFMLNQRLAKIMPNSKITNDYLLYSIRSEPYLRILYSLASGTKQANLSNDDILNIPIFVSPLPEQTTIVAFLDQETAKIDNLIQQAQKATTLLQERRTALISAAVTGKIDLRGFVKSVAEQVNT